MAKISIIVPVYNSAPYLNRCLDSIVNQTLSDIEILIVDDGSTDDSKLIIEQYAEKDNRIHVTYFKTNSGVSIARNHAIKNATGEFIGFVDSDDYVDNNYFEELYSYSPEYDVIRGIRVINKENRHGKNKYGCIIPSIIKNEFLKKHNLKFPINKLTGEDSTFKRWIYNHTNKIFECPDKGIYYHYMKRPGSLSNYNINEDLND